MVEDFKKFVGYKRNLLRLSMTDVALLMGCSVSTYSRLENGNSMWLYTHIYKFATLVCKYSLVDLFTEYAKYLEDIK